MSRAAAVLLLLAVPIAYAAGRVHGPIEVLEVRVSTLSVAGACVRSQSKPQTV